LSAVPPLEQRALQSQRADPRDEEWADLYAGGRAGPEAPTAPKAEGPTPVEAFSALLKPWTEEEFEAAREPYPHAFQERHVGLFPIGEVTVVAATGREGKTTVQTGMATAMVIGHSLAGMLPLADRSVIVYSAEDDRRQFAAKVAAQCSLLAPIQAQRVRERLIVPNLDDLGRGAVRELVMVIEGKPVQSGTVETIIEAIRPLMDASTPPGLLVFETASTLTEAEESNQGWSVLVKALKWIARELQVAVLVSHHVSQASLSNLPDLSVSTADIRGGTALVNNARQCAILVNLGSDDAPFADTDARTVLRRMVAGNEPGKVTAWITLDSSKGIAPPPIFFRWISTEWVPAAVELDAPPELADRSWPKVREMLVAERADAKAGAKEERASAKTGELVQKAVDAVQRLQASYPGEVTARRVRELLGRSQEVTSRLLGQAVAEGHLEMTTARVRNREAAVYGLAGHGTAEGRRNG
jgi:hypothetical protein